MTVYYVDIIQNAEYLLFARGKALFKKNMLKMNERKKKSAIHQSKYTERSENDKNMERL